MISEEFVQGLLLSFLSWYHSESDVFKVACTLTRSMYPQYSEMACLDTIPNSEIEREVATSVYYPDSAPPSPGIILISGSSPADSASMKERKNVFVEQGFAVMILDSFSRERVLEDCFRKSAPCRTFQHLTGNYWNNTMAQPQECPAINYQATGKEVSLLLKAYLDRISTGAIFSPSERAHDVYEALRLFRHDDKIDSNNLALVGYSHGASAILEALTFTGNQIPPPGDEVFSSEEHSLEGVKAAVAYYPNCRPGTYFERHAHIKDINLQLHLADRDEYVKPELCQSVIDQIKISRTDQKLQTYHYDELHAFDMKEYGAAYNEPSKKLSYARALRFIRETIDPK